ncbi:hypothetical protein T440DRAFT_224988 [Plenodomus tracheiphilus IPT5]|uniref:Uncharacterized protein n=1 Tax=Plenodomus tracheiphilus IPT5 TaxID=1408161 RepID=A0A6A7AWY4_9PLEO|nr:hypothetical protein T440DRAFT_224988 [Plenodomus tracheiphilus IPT5]
MPKSKSSSKAELWLSPDSLAYGLRGCPSVSKTCRMRLAAVAATRLVVVMVMVGPWCPLVFNGRAALGRSPLVYASAKVQQI